ncbi:hypothetical protein [Saccharomonospora iraqiensis]|uniref:hypothetical protein n=1 Tax=Saccharomonospora iraqiensis TaxID=52698 RepID=UPI0004797ADA|nr:hypothetical protein [Saccharomonospora iraqiensis]
MRTSLPLTTLAALSALSLAAPVAFAGPATPAASAPEDCRPPVAVGAAEPACNPHLADSPWPGNHRNSYAQASSPFPGPTGPAERINVDHDGVASAPIVLSFSPEYPDGDRVIWASTVGFTNEILKIDPETVTVIDKYIPQLEEGAGPGTNSVSGAYNLVDADNRLHVGQATALEVYGDADPGRRDSTIALLRRFDLPAEALCGDDDQLVGLTMTYDGHIAFTTEKGMVGVVPRSPERMTAEHLRTFPINGQDCAGGPDGEVETVSNSIAADENGGLYVVTSRAMYRIDWDGAELAQRWRSGYAGAGSSGGGRLGAGSGSTPTLMGTAPGDDRFVVITDGQELMHLVLMWRDEVPAGWEPIREGADRRIACEVPVTFGDGDADRSLSEQSVLVRGNSAVVVNNLQRLDPVLRRLPSRVAPYSQLLSGLPGNAPAGIQRVAWDPESRTCDVVWSNPDVAIPNGIPTMSAATDMLYGIGTRDGVWTLEGLDWDTGEVALTVETTAFPTSNSFYAATTVGPAGTVWTGNFGGVTRFESCDPAREPDCGRRLGPVEATVGTVPSDSGDALRDTVGLPNDSGATG